MKKEHGKYNDINFHKITTKNNWNNVFRISKKFKIKMYPKMLNLNLMINVVAYKLESEQRVVELCSVYFSGYNIIIYLNYYYE